jgi:UDP-N-acetylglucosamine--N-acetylmuramyl-(pentapeptide) pyrophosphoryl-undecaprenol N-acetylglucosamine transferase
MIFSGVIQAFNILKRVQPSVVIGFGGYPTFPPIVAAILRHIPTCIHEQNAVLGRVNRLVAPYVHAIASTFVDPRFLRLRDVDKIVITGNPVRDAVMTCASTPYVAPSMKGRINLLVFGGSQGARVMSDIVPGALARLPNEIRKRLNVVQQVRQEDIKRAFSLYAVAGIKAELKSFFDDMPARIAAAHLVISRSGASTVAELSIIGRPAILVPFPHSLDNDQKANAEKLEASGAGFMIEQHNFTEEALSTRLVILLDDVAKLDSTAKAARSQGAPDAVQLLADLVDMLGHGEFRTMKSLIQIADNNSSSGTPFLEKEDY